MRIVIVFALLIVMVFGAVNGALAMEHDCTGRAYGEHISWHAQQGHLGKDMNPGMHRGFRGFCEEHDHGDM